MGDRNNPIKFGPEWLRNLSRERSTGSSTSSGQNVAAASGSATSPGATGSSGGASGSSGGATATSPTTASMTNTAATTNQSPKVQLAKLRYGREEMLALYDRTAEAPSELKFIELLYQPRGKPPFALNNTFEDEMRDNMRSSAMGGISPGERFGMGRGMGRGMSVSEGRGRPRVPFVRQPSTGRGVTWHMGASPRTPGYGNAVDDDAAMQSRSWSNSNSGSAPGRNSGEQSEWTPNKMFRSKRQGNNTNWRQPISRDDGEEWRSPEPGRSRSTQDKWERDWGDRPTQDKPQSWNSNRRTWVAGDTQNNDENLPEWAVENAEACGGTFDSSGAFHGYSNDDSNLPKSQESSYALARSHTHGNFSRAKTVEEGSEEWWASEKAKKLSPKRFDASDIKFKKQTSTGVPDTSTGNGGGANSNPIKDDKLQEGSEKHEKATEPPENNMGGHNDEKFKKNAFKSKFNENKTFGALMRSDINEEANDERGNFQSVMITTNNALRQKHQNIVSSANDISKQNRKPGLLHLIQNSASQTVESDHGKQHQSQEDKIVEEIFDITLEDKDLMSKMPQSPIINPSSGSMPSGMPTAVNTMIQMPNPAMQLNSISPGLPVQGLNMNSKPNMSSSAMQVPGMPSSGMQQVGITNSALNASLGLPLGPGSNPMGMTLQGVPPPVLPNTGMTNPGMGASGMQGNIGVGAIQAGATGMPGFPPGGGMQAMAGSNVPNASLFLGQNSNNTQMPLPNDIQMPNHGGQHNMFPMHGLPHSGSQNAFGPSIYSNMMQSPPTPANPNSQNLADQWYYEDPKKIIQGPFCSKEMYGWYRAGFFSPSLMVRRACDTHMRPLGSYGPVVPFAQMDMLSSFPLSAGFEPRNQGPHESMLNPQQSLGLDVMSNMNLSEAASIDSLQFGTVGLMRNPPFGQQQMVDSLWSQPSPSPEILWMQQNMSGRNENRVNNLPMFFWDQQPSAITSNALLPEEIAKEMKTEDQILAQLRASQSAAQNMHFRGDQTAISVSNKPREEDNFPPNSNATPNLEELQKIMQKDTLTANAVVTEDQKVESQESQALPEKAKVEQPSVDSNAVKQQQQQPQQPQQQQKEQQQPQQKPSAETKQSKSAKAEKETKNKENNSTKNKNKKTKEEKKDEAAELKNKQEEVKKRSEEPSPTKSKKEEKISKKELEREKKELIKEGFTIVKSEKSSNKENKKKAEEAKIAEEAERKRKEEEKLAAEEEKKRKQAEASKKAQAAQEQPQRQVTEAVVKKSPWSAVANQSMQATNKDGMTLAEIQRLEREKKLEQMKEQQQMMQIIAQQQAAALAREQEMQAGLGWAKKKGTNFNTPGQSLVEIQAEARKQAAAAAAAAAATQASEETNNAPQPAPVPWSNAQNGVGFWDTQPNQSKAEKPQEPSKPEPKPKKKQVTLISPAKKNTSPVVEFEGWCTSVLRHWKDSIDVPTFVSFLKDIESPYEVKDYVKCYLGENKETSDFARQFLERRSKLLRVGMVTPSDDLSSPAMAVIPRTTSNSDYQEVKGKGKKSKKNKMLKVDARILGFSVTAAEDRINVGDIDTV